VKVWLISFRVDAGLMMAPAWLALLWSLGLPDGEQSPWWVYLFIVLALDVGHVWATLFRTYMDPVELSRRTWLYLSVPILSAVGCLVLHSLGSGIFWRVMAYAALFHFMRQQYGFTALYRLRQGLPGRCREASVERWMIHSLVLFPVLWWHVHLPRDFSWFVEGDFVQGLPAWTLWPAGLATAALVLAHAFYRVRSRLWSPGRDLWALTTGLVWFGGIIWTHGDLPFTLTNVVAHGLPYYVLVLWVSRRKWTQQGRGALRPWLFQGAGLLASLSMLLGLAFLEEGLWDVFVWQENSWLFGSWAEPSGLLGSMAACLLAVPQVTHYILDGYIWKMSDNPGLRDAIAGD
jgi:hypothetical protein